MRFWAMCRTVVKLAGALPVLIRHSSSRNVIVSRDASGAHLSMAQWSLVIGPECSAGKVSEVM